MMSRILDLHYVGKLETLYDGAIKRYVHVFACGYSTAVRHVLAAARFREKPC